jgi:uncharacterized membrane protein
MCTVPLLQGINPTAVYYIYIYIYINTHALSLSLSLTRENTHTHTHTQKNAKVYLKVLNPSILVHSFIYLALVNGFSLLPDLPLGTVQIVYQ